MSEVVNSIDVNVPVHTAYDQWTQFESFPEFMEGVQEVRQIDDTHMHWRAEVAGREKEWDATIVEQHPDEVIAWTTTGGAYNAGEVRFEDVGPDQTRITLRLAYDPEGVVENVGDMLGFVSRRVKGDLERFKDFIEARGTATGAWRGEVERSPRH